MTITRQTYINDIESADQAAIDHETNLRNQADHLRLAEAKVAACERLHATGGSEAEWDQVKKAREQLDRAQSRADGLASMTDGIHAARKKAYARRAKFAEGGLSIGGNPWPNPTPFGIAQTLASTPRSEFGGLSSQWCHYNTLTQHCIIADTNELTTGDAVADAMNGTLGVLHNTGSPVRGLWRWRIIIPHEPITPDEAMDAMDGLRSRLEAAGITTRPPVWPLLTPAASVSRDREQDIRLLPGKVADIDELIAEAAASPKPTKPKANRQHEARA